MGFIIPSGQHANVSSGSTYFQAGMDLHVIPGRRVRGIIDMSNGGGYIGYTFGSPRAPVGTGDVGGDGRLAVKASPAVRTRAKRTFWAPTPVRARNAESRPRRPSPSPAQPNPGSSTPFPSFQTTPGDAIPPSSPSPSTTTTRPPALCFPVRTPRAPRENTKTKQVRHLRSSNVERVLS